MAASVALASALDKWRARWPEWNVGASFVVAADRDTAFAWFALLQEFTEAAWDGHDATPGLAKLAWWHEELIGWSKGARRHPLGEALQRADVDWTSLAHALRALPTARERPAGVAQGAVPVDAALDALAVAIASGERALFAGAGGLADAASPTTIVRDLLGERALLFGDIAFCRNPGNADAAGPATLPRRLYGAFLGERMRVLRDRGVGAPATPWRSLRLAWRAARGRR